MVRLVRASGVAVGWRDDSPANVRTPCQRVELHVAGDDLASGRVADGEVVDALDRVLVRADLGSLPAPGDVDAIVPDIEGVHAGDGGSCGDTGCFVN